jgi:hypothetical protein
MILHHCGTRLKPGHEFVIRSFVWLAVLLVFALGQLAISWYDENMEVGFRVLPGLPIAYAFGKAVLFRIRGTPLTWHQLRDTALHAVAYTFGLLVVLPIIIYVTLLLLFFAIYTGLVPW